MKRALSLLALGACLLWPVAEAKPPGEVPVGGTLREASMQGLNGPSRKLSSYLGKPLIINVWASWCGPCRQEMASLERLAWRDEAARFTVIGISTDDYADKAQAYLKQVNATLPHFIDKNLEMEQMLGADRLPLTLLIDAKGHVIEKIYGARAWDGPEALQLINKAFKPR